MEGSLSSVQPLRLELIDPASPYRECFEAWLADYHYLGYRGTVGENLQYLVWSAHGQALACLVFEAATWKVQARDAWLGWSAPARRAHLRWVTNNSRFLILAGVRVPNLASHVLSLVMRRLRADWQAKYGHAVALVETFVERHRFQGCCYRAANWQCLGPSRGRGTKSTSKKKNTSIKELWVYPLGPNFRQQLLCPP